MNELNDQPRACRNGHRTRDAAARFCIVCGAPLAAAPQTARQQFDRNPIQSNGSSAPPRANQPLLNVVQHQPPPDFVQHQQNAFQPPNFGSNQTRAMQCRTCGGAGGLLPEKIFVCPVCRWLRPLAPGYQIDPAAFQWAEDGTAMRTLRSVGALNSAARAISQKVGRRWIETTLNGVLLSERQMPEIYFPAVRAARILGVSHMPDVYVSGEAAWDCHTYGSDADAFVVVGSALAASFGGAEMSFLLAREMGRVRANHALWKSVLQFLVGEQTQQRRGLMSNGILGALNPMTMLENAVEVPLLAWARQAEITADRAGMLAVGDESVARRVLLSWSLKSEFLARRINVAAWLEQQAASSDDGAARLSELVSTATPYITRRLALMQKFAESAELRRWRELISRFAPPLKPTGKPSPPQPQKPPRTPNDAPPQNQNVAKSPQTAATGDEIKIKCAACQTLMRFARRILNEKSTVNVRCPNAACRKVLTLKAKNNAAHNAAARRREEGNFAD